MFSYWKNIYLVLEKCWKVYYLLFSYSINFVAESFHGHVDGFFRSSVALKRTAYDCGVKFSYFRARQQMPGANVTGWDLGVLWVPKDMALGSRSYAKLCLLTRLVT